MDERLHKFLARAGVASRRSAERLIDERRVAVNNRVVTEQGTKVDPDKDLVTVDGKLIQPREAPSYFIFYKPPGVVTTMDDPLGRPSVADYFKKLGRRLFPVGRLDYDAEGALLVTDDGELAHRLAHPRFAVPRTYLAKVKGRPEPAALERLRRGVRLDDGLAKPLSVRVHSLAEKNTWLAIVVSEGRPHLIKRLCAAVGHPVVRLFRPSYAGVDVEGLRPGEMRALRAGEVGSLQAASAAPPDRAPLRLPARRHRARAPDAGVRSRSETGARRGGGKRRSH